MTSEEEFPGEETEIDVGRRVEESEKPEGDLRSKTEEREMSGEPGEPRDRETGAKKAANEDRRRLKTGEQLCEAPKSSRETPGKNGGSRHVPGGAWHTQPISPYPRGTRERTGIPEITSEEEFPGEETEIDVGRRVEESEKPEGDL
ncbi:hypothetical protein NDU88_010420 [Pleurodeles waltl]|uniref:Uncharacterized protein n=1 Tax=Pleurodeles waltl TaxID=8319 RepID=A0AAV7S1W0_PLEWA|nr:hypothetical protein NDU88_010420 [Pleurodeles waltl]